MSVQMIIGTNWKVSQWLQQEQLERSKQLFSQNPQHKDHIYYVAFARAFIVLCIYESVIIRITRWINK